MLERVATKEDLEKAKKDLSVNLNQKSIAQMQKELQSLTQSIDGIEDEDDYK